MATHVVPTAEYWRTGVQIPPAPPKSKEEDALGRLFLWVGLGNPPGAEALRADRPCARAEHRRRDEEKKAGVGRSLSLRLGKAVLDRAELSKMY